MRTTTKARRVVRRGLGHRGAVAAAITAALAVIAVACGDDGGGSGGGTDSTGAGESVLGPMDVAQGEPVMIGMVSDGTDANIDNIYQVDASEAIVEYINNHRGGIGGRPIEFLHCETGQANASKSNECANELIREGAVLILMPEATGVSAVHEVTSEAEVPLFLYSITDTNVTTDTGSTFVLFNPRAGVSSLPISVAETNDVDKVTPVVIDVPAATDLYSSATGMEPFDEAGLELDLVPLPPSQADFTPQMTEIANGDPTVVQIVGNDVFCISAFQGLEAAAFDGPISTLFPCVTDATRDAVGGYLEGTYVSVSTPIGDEDDAGFQQLQAAYDTYGGNEVDDITQAQNTFSVWMAMYQVIEDMTGEITPATLTEAYKSMPNMKIPGTPGIWYRCNGNALPELPAVCSAGGLRSRLDAEGFPSLPYTVVGNERIPG